MTTDEHLAAEKAAEKYDRKQLAWTAAAIGGIFLVVAFANQIATTHATDAQAATAPSELTDKELIAHKNLFGLTYNECLRKERLEARAIVMVMSKGDPGDNDPSVQSIAKSWCDRVYENTTGVLKDTR